MTLVSSKYVSFYIQVNYTIKGPLKYWTRLGTANAVGKRFLAYLLISILEFQASKLYFCCELEWSGTGTAYVFSQAVGQKVPLGR